MKIITRVLGAWRLRRERRKLDWVTVCKVCDGVVEREGHAPDCPRLKDEEATA